MIESLKFDNATGAWQHQLSRVMEHGSEVEPRGKPTLEVQHSSLAVDMKRPNVCVKERGLSYSFMAAEALWMINGDDTVAGIAPYNENIAQFSDDGETFFGAYGPKIVDQSDYIVNKLLQDRRSRQATLTIWRENPKDSADIPCTVALDWKIRHGDDDIRPKIHCHAFMRSSDTYLGLPYDFFNFSMVTAWLASRYNDHFEDAEDKVLLGDLHWTAASSHIYQDPENFPYDMEDVRECAEAENLHESKDVDTPRVPRGLYHDKESWRRLARCLRDARGDIERQHRNMFTPKPKM